MMDDGDQLTALETAARREITRLVDAIDVGAEPLRPPADRPTGARSAVRRRMVVAAGLGTVAAAAAGIVAVAPLRTEAPAPDLVIGVSAEGQCEERVAEDGLVAAGVLPGGGVWEFQIEQEGGWLNGWLSIDDRRSGGWGHDDQSWPAVVNAGQLSAELQPIEDGLVVSVLAPPDSAKVTVELVNGRELVMCPVAVPVTTAVEFAAGFIPDGIEVRAIRVEDARGRRIAWADDVPTLSSSAASRDADERLRAKLPADAQLSPGHEERSAIGFGLDIDPDLVHLPLGGAAVPEYVDPLATAVEVAAGDLPVGRWSVRAGSNGDETAIELIRPDGTRSGWKGGTVDQLLRDLNWDVDLIAGRYILWGFVPDDVATVVVSLADGAELRILPSRRDVAGLDLPAFGAELPEHAVITDVEGHDASGSARYRAELSNLEVLAGTSGPASAGLLVEPVG